MKKKDRKIVIAVVVGAVILLALFKGGLFNIYVDSGLYVQNHVPDYVNISWNGYKTSITTTYLGSFVNTLGNDACGNDADLTISNSYDTLASSLHLSSSIGAGTVAHARSCAGNNILAEIALPTGVLSGTCTLSPASPTPEGTMGGNPMPIFCEIDKVSGEPQLCDVTEQGCQDRTTQRNINGNQMTSTQDFSINITEPMTVRVLAFSARGAEAGGGSADITLNFIPSVPPPCAGDDCNPIDYTTIIMYVVIGLAVVVGVIFLYIKVRKK